MTSESPLAAPASSLLDLAATSPYYRLSAFIVWACVGIILTRLLIAPSPPRRTSTVRLTGITVSFAAAVAALFIVHKAGVFELAPYSGTHTELIFNSLMVCAALTGSFVLVRVLPRTLSHAIGAVGQMAFTHYCLQVLALAAWVRWVMPQDDSWLVMCGLIVGSCLVTALWRVVIRRQPWNRGIIEGGTDALVALTRR